MISSSISEQDFQEYSELIEQGMSQRSACDVLSLSRSSIQRYLKKLNELSNSDDVVTETYPEFLVMFSFLAFFAM